MFLVLSFCMYLFSILDLIQPYWIYQSISLSLFLYLLIYMRLLQVTRVSALNSQHMFVLNQAYGLYCSHILLPQLFVWFNSFWYNFIKISHFSISPCNYVNFHSIYLKAMLVGAYKFMTYISQYIIPFFIMSCPF